MTLLCWRSRRCRLRSREQPSLRRWSPSEETSAQTYHGRLGYVVKRRPAIIMFLRMLYILIFLHIHVHDICHAINAKNIVRKTSLAN